MNAIKLKNPPCIVPRSPFLGSPLVQDRLGQTLVFFIVVGDLVQKIRSYFWIDRIQRRSGIVRNSQGGVC